MTNFERKVLVLDSRYEPVKIVSMHVGFVLLYTERAETLVESDRTIRSVSRTFTVPWILRLNNSFPKNRRLQGPRFSRQNVYLRDGYRCQYCNWSGPLAHLTLDHLIPSSKGGKTTWENIVTACKTCNLRKGMRAPEEVGLRLNQPPARPQFHPGSLFALRFGLNRNNIPPVWLPYVDLSVLDKMTQAIASSPLNELPDEKAKTKRRPGLKGPSQGKVVAALS
jgi:5-methylcytosine-specific restriction endonuclease McrA